MKKLFLILVWTLTVGFNMLAQSDSFFKTDNDDIYNRLEDPTSLGLNLPHSNIGSTTNEPAAPLGSGLLILTALGAGYAIRKRKK